MSRHDALRATWAPGQIWETRLDELAHDENAWVPVADNGRAQPAWDERQEYRRVGYAQALTLQEARRILSEQDVTNPARAIEAVALVLRFEGIADASLLPIAGRLEAVAGSVRSMRDKPE